MTRSPGSNSEWIYQRLKEHGCRITRPRQVILDILRKVKRHLTAQNIYIAVHRIYPETGLASIYRNLGLFVGKGIVLKYDFGDNQTRYELVHGPEETHHHHLICKNCNKVIDYSESIDDEREFLKRREKNLSKKYDFKIKGHFIDFVGLCKKCKNRSTNS